MGRLLVTADQSKQVPRGREASGSIRSTPCHQSFDEGLAREQVHPYSLASGLMDPAEQAVATVVPCAEAVLKEKPRINKIMENPLSCSAIAPIHRSTRTQGLICLTSGTEKVENPLARPENRL